MKSSLYVFLIFLYFSSTSPIRGCWRRMEWSTRCISDRTLVVHAMWYMWSAELPGLLLDGFFLTKRMEASDHSDSTYQPHGRSCWSWHPSRANRRTVWWTLLSLTHTHTHTQRERERGHFSYDPVKLIDVFFFSVGRQEGGGNCNTVDGC